jgi:signal transduction histidine kinase
MKEVAEAANRAKSTFLANISHEIRTPLGRVLMAANLAAADNPDPSQKEYLDIIIPSGKSLQLLLNDVLDLSKIEADKMELQVSDFSMRECLKECIRLFRNNAREKGLELVLSVGDSVPELVSGDPLRLRQIILNLVGNAIKFTARGSVTVSVECGDCVAGRLPFEFSVADTGIGIPPEKHLLVFHEFEQAENTTSIRGNRSWSGHQQQTGAADGRQDVAGKRRGAREYLPFHGQLRTGYRLPEAE